MKISIRIKNLLPALLVLFAGFAAMTLIAGFSGRKMLFEEMESTTRAALVNFIAQANQRESELGYLQEVLDEQNLKLATSLAEFLAADPSLLEGGRLIRLADELGVEEIHITDGEGILRWGSVPDFFGFDFKTTDQTIPFLPALEDPEFKLAQEPQPRGTDGALFQYIGVARRNVPGVVQIGVSVNAIQALQERVSLQTLVEGIRVDEYGGYVFVVDLEGTITAHPSRSMLTLSVADTEWGQQVLSGTEGSFSYDQGGDVLLMAYKRVGDRVFGASVSTEPYLAPLKTLEGAMVSASLVTAAILAILVFLVITYTVVRPLRRLNDKILVLSEGEGDLTQTIDVVSRDEVGDLGRGINSFIASLRQIVENIKSASAENQVIKENLRQNAEESSTAVGQIGGNVEEISRKIGGLDERISGSTETVKAIGVNIQGLNQQVENQSSAVIEATASVNEMVASLKSVASITQAKKAATESLVVTTREGGDKLSQMSDVVQVIAGNVEKITEMVTVINDIASQTDLLSMNAAIEAAHAGDAGRGFAVVAEEIRKLSETTRENARAINDVLEGIGSQARQASAASKSTDQAFLEIDKEVTSVSQALSEINASTEELSLGGEQILEAMQMLQDVSSRVREGSEEMENGAAGMGEAMQTVREISGEVLNLVKDIARGSSLISQSTMAVNQLTAELDNTAQRLDQEIHRFKTN